MEISEEFIKGEVEYHRTQFEKWSKMLKSINEPKQKKMTKKEKEIILHTDLNKFARRSRKKRAS